MLHSLDLFVAKIQSFMMFRFSVVYAGVFSNSQKPLSLRSSDYELAGEFSDDFWTFSFFLFRAKIGFIWAFFKFPQFATL